MTSRKPTSLLILVLTACLGACATQGPADHALGPNAASQIRDAMDRIDPERAMQTVETLASFGTRHTLSGTESDSRGLGAAQRWLIQQLNDAGIPDATIEEIYLEKAPRIPDGGRVSNVVAHIPGSDPGRRDQQVYMLAHLDSRASDVMDSEIDAPGANDDASGCAVLFEVARSLAQDPPEMTTVYIFTGGEEQGLLGARFAASAAREAGADIRAVLSNDVVGDPSAPAGFKAEPGRVRVFAAGLTPNMSDEDISRIRRYGMEADTPSRQLGRFVAETARLVDTGMTPLVIARTDRFLRGGDHYAFLETGFPALRFTEVQEDYTRQHQDIRTEDGVEYGDLVEHIDPDYMTRVARLNLATVMRVANAPSPPGRARLITAELTNDTTIRWDASPERDVAGYVVLWRDTTASDWQHTMDVGDVTEATLNLSKDNWFFGVRAYDADGYASPVVFPEAARE